MTKQIQFSAKSEFSAWLRKQKCIASSLGFVASDIDYVWRNYNTGLWMFLEEKVKFKKESNKSSITNSQLRIFRILHEAFKNYEDYRGFHLIQFENTTPDNGKMYLNEKEITKDNFFKFLQFEKDIVNIDYFKRPCCSKKKLNLRICPSCKEPEMKKVETIFECDNCNKRFSHKHKRRKKINNAR